MEDTVEEARVWTPEREEMLRSMWPVVNYLTKNIAKTCGVTEHAVLRKAQRLGLPSRRERMEWNEKQVARLAALVEEELSASRIANALGTSKGAVIGKCQRLGLALKIPHGKGGRPKGTPNKLTRQIFSSKPYRPKKQQPIKAIAPAPFNVRISDLREGECKYCVTPDRPFLFCAHPQKPGSSYCEFHHESCYRLYLERKRKVPIRRFIGKWAA